MSGAPSPLATERVELVYDRARHCEELVRELSLARWGGQAGELELVAHLAGALRRALPNRRTLLRVVEPRAAAVRYADGEPGLGSEWRDGPVRLRRGALSQDDTERLGPGVVWVETGTWAYPSMVDGFSLLMGDAQGPLILLDVEYPALVAASTRAVDYELAVSLVLAWLPTWQATILRGEVARLRPLASLGELVAGLAHELNNPITAISGYGELLLERLEAATQHGAATQPAPVDSSDLDRMRKIVECAERMRQLTRALIGYVRPSQERLTDVGLNQVVRGAVAMCEHTIERSRAVVQLECCSGEPWLRVGRLQLEQIVVNLLTNACDALGPEGGTIRIATGVDTPPPAMAGRALSLSSGLGAALSTAQEAYILVEDNGKGIRAADLPRVFDPFFTTKVEGKGTGLGLAIVRKIVDGYGGTVDVRSQEGQGTTVTVRFGLSAARYELP